MSDFEFARAVSTPAGEEHVSVGGVDITWFAADRPDDTPTKIPGYTLIEPFGYGSSETLVIPRTNYYFQQPRVGALSWLTEGAEVRYYRVLADDSIEVDYVGFVTALVRDGKNWAAEVDGQVAGRAANKQKTPPPVRKVYDIGHAMSFAAYAMKVSIDPPNGPVTGIFCVNQGDMSWLSWMQQLCSLSQTRDAQRRAFMPKVWGKKTFEFRTKDTDTIHLTGFADGDKTVLDLKADLTQRVTAIYGTGIDPDGTRWRNNRYQGFFDEPPPEYPMFDTSETITVGMTDADTDSGDGITILNIHLKWFHLLAPLDPGPIGTYTQAMANAVREVKGDAGLADNGTLDLAAWNAIWDIDVVGYTNEGARQFPLAQDERTRVWDYSATGQIVGRNPLYDPTIVEVERAIDYGPGVSKATAIQNARKQIEDAKIPAWVGTVTLVASGAFSGERDTAYAEAVQADPDAYTDDLVPLQAIRPGWNLLLPYFDGGTQVHISTVQVSGADTYGNRTATLTVDTHARDAMELAEIIANREEGKRDLRREWLVGNQAAKPLTNYVAHDEWFGQLDRNVPLIGNQWNVVGIIVGSSGQVNRTRIQTINNEAEFCVAVFRKDITAAQVENLVGNPFPVDSLTQETVWDQDHLASWFDSKRILYSYGNELQPGGYGWRKHTGADGEPTSAPLNGLLADDTPWPYMTISTDLPFVTLAIYPDRDCKLKAGQLFYAQEDDVT